MKHEDAKPIVEKWLEALSPSCERIEAAGSYRRGKPEVKDIDLVCVPKIQTEPDLFGGPGTQINLLEVAISKLFWDRFYTARLKDGPRQKQLLTTEGMHLELWIVLPPAEFGVIYLIRTGPADFGHWCVTTRNKGGALPSFYQFREGAIWKRQEKIRTPEEKDVFHLLGLGYLEPEERRAEWRTLEHG